ncbi:MAG: M23 family metallopeptidase [bacterium]|nr:M23 family metallopeptidase [bacterium]
MKRWTVMLIPHDRAGTRTLNLSSFQIWSVVAAFVVLSFVTGFFVNKTRLASQRATQFEHEHALLQQALRASEDEAASPQGSGDEAALEELRLTYEARDRTLTQELTELYDLEREIRELHQFEPRVRRDLGFVDAGGPPAQPMAEGEPQGGPPGDVDGDGDVAPVLAALRPPHVIYGLSRPSADLIALEIALRRDSLRDLLKATRDEHERIARTPSIWPSREANRRLTSRFGWRRDPFTHKGRHHSGLDIGATYNSPVLSTGRGTVIFSGYEKYFGNVVRIEHGYGFVTVYAHLAKRLVEKGDTVERYDTIGKLGSTGRSTGPHIHYEVHVDGKAVNPQKYLKE